MRFGRVLRHPPAIFRSFKLGIERTSKAEPCCRRTNWCSFSANVDQVERSDTAQLGIKVRSSRELFYLPYVKPEDPRHDTFEALQRKLPEVTVVASEETAKYVAAVLCSPELRSHFHTWRLETEGFNPNKESPIGRSRIVCASVFCGHHINFGHGPGLWIKADEENILQCFKPYFEDQDIAKAFFNSSSDVHALRNHDIVCRGLAGDVRHMAKTLYTDLGDRSLNQLARRLLRRGSFPLQKYSFFKQDALKFRRRKKLRFRLPMLQSQERPKRVYPVRWIHFQAQDAKNLWNVRHVLHELLAKTGTKDFWGNEKSLWTVYTEHVLPYSILLTEVERVGIRVDIDQLQKAEQRLLALAKSHEDRFYAWLRKTRPRTERHMNHRSIDHQRALFFGKTGRYWRPGRHLLRRKQRRTTLISKRSKPGMLKTFSMLAVDLPVLRMDYKGKPQVSHEILRELSGNPERGEFGVAQPFIGDEGCWAIYSLVEAQALETQVKVAVSSIYEALSECGRVHANMNILTKSGRMYTQRANLQGQPSKLKDIAGIRRCFVPEKENKFIGADYDQIEPRVMTALSGSERMLKEFRQGTDFHSKLAVQIFPEIQAALEAGKVKEGSDSSSLPSVKDVFPEQRDEAKKVNFSLIYGMKLKTMAKKWNMDVTSVQEIRDAWIDLMDIREFRVRTLLQILEEGCIHTILGRFRPISSPSRRYWYKKDSDSKRSESLTSTFNAPVQSSAADVVLSAMLKIWRDPRLRELDWRIILQVHDEILLEGPEESAEEAAVIIKRHMEDPFENNRLPVPLKANVRIGDSWMDVN